MKKKIRLLTVLMTLASSVHLQGQERWVDTVLAFSSEYNPSPGDWSAHQIVGIPNVYPNHGDSVKAWASETTDDQREWLVLHFEGPAAPIKWIDIYETYYPGAVDTIYALDAGTWHVLWYGTADTTIGDTSRIFNVTFSPTSYNVSVIRLAINSPAVMEWNEIDAVSIGYYASGVEPVSAQSPFCVSLCDGNAVRIDSKRELIGARAGLYSIEGRRLSDFVIESEATTVSLEGYAAGIYALRVGGAGMTFFKP